MSLPQSHEELRGLCVDDVGMGMLATAEYLRKYGWWCAGRVENTGSHCTITALQMPLPDFKLRKKAWQRLINHLALDVETNSEVRAIADWNDHPSRTADEVIEALQAAAFASVK